MRSRRLDEQRSWALMVATLPEGGTTEAASSEVIGSLTFSMAKPLAPLPPPFPSDAPTRAYVSNVAVSPRHRRRGVARALLGAAERRAARLGQAEIWLHVDAENAGANALYDALGYEDMGLEPAPVAAINLRERRRTLRKRLLVPLWRR